MRGKRASIARKKVDTVLLAVRYQPQDGKLALARGIERRGAVWSDWKLFDRQTLVDQLQAGRRIATGREAELAGDLELIGRVRLAQTDGDQPVLTANGDSSAPGQPVDRLGLPLF